MHKKLYRSREHRMISGVMGGLGEHFTIDPVVPRILLVIAVIGTGIFPGVIAYIVAAFMIDEAPYITPSKIVVDDDISV